MAMEKRFKYLNTCGTTGTSKLDNIDIDYHYTHFFKEEEFLVFNISV